MRGLLFVFLAMCAACPLLGAAAPDYSDPVQLAALITQQPEPYVLVDVRTAEEYEAGHIPTAINISYHTIASAPPTDDTAALIIVYCASGNRSSKAAAALKRLGYTRIVDFGAVGRWQGDLVTLSEQK
jgi:rhodanese-related sulfurtransferase